MELRICLGTLNDFAGTFADGEKVYLSQHSWDCDWYWGFGYVGNAKCNFHFDGLLKSNKTSLEIFSEPCFSDTQWWVIRDLFVQAYALKHAAEAYRHGGHQTFLANVTNVIKSQKKSESINNDLQQVLDTLWNYMKANYKTEVK